MCLISNTSTLLFIFILTDLLYRQTVPINGTPVELEVIDVSGSNADKFPAEQVMYHNIYRETAKI